MSWSVHSGWSFQQMVDGRGITGSAAAVAVAVAAAIVPAFLQVLVALVMGMSLAFFFGMPEGWREDGGRTEVTCNYDLDLLCNTYSYLISILGGFGQQALVHLCIWTSGGPTAQILKSQFGPKIWCDLHHDLCHDLSHDLSVIWATVNAPNR